MWQAIKSDLFDFVTTIQEDTTKTLNKVLGEEEEVEDVDKIMREKLIADIRRSYETYSTPVKDTSKRDYERYLKKFDLGSFAADVASTLDVEPEVSRFYAELVPIQISPQEFWARLFFRIKMVNRDGSGAFEEDEDDEELLWEGEDTKDEITKQIGIENEQSTTSTTVSPTLQTTKTGNLKGNNHLIQLQELQTRNKQLEEENTKLHGQVKILVARVAQLESMTRPSTSNIDNILPTNTQDTVSDSSHLEISHDKKDFSSSHTTFDTQPIRIPSSSNGSDTSSEGSTVLINESDVTPPVPSTSTSNVSPPVLSSSSDTKRVSSSKPITTTTEANSPNIPLLALDEEEDDEWN
mmetsp:Transcript_1155/g.1913  ORF Transcript_1155/g.1913 Transcript_1155/m.1913 type:complete len:352 (-) Transcript_1155:144-1199(-)|eukprot:CAMPEP_0170069704 /NCGR_PEP_ID=MMETSP0019_2-20121128/8280_1 /TAXON_ID=98059 /ORGANISM="Dinobryon sp., Strain UTEXLB2267" /LENGTH=351 /DNA_ID=CAMNT_0010277817 /DNA_START=940 /DNA_END=1995 /DNA_ORIENTATION=+